MSMLVALDSFKNSISAEKIGALFESNFEESFSLPLADGGENSLDIVSKYLDVEKIELETMDTYFSPAKCYYYIDRKNRRAYIESALIAGLPATQNLNIWKSTSFGVGILIHEALSQGAEEIYLFLGGTGCADSGLDLLSGLRFTFFDKNNNEISPTTDNVGRVEHIIRPSGPLPNCKFYLISDVENPLLGTEGMNAIYSPQKGATSNDIPKLEENTQRFAEKISQESGQEMMAVPSSGAAGGIPFALMNFFDYEVISGISYIARLGNLEEKIKDASVVITGEGRIDEQSFYGKTISYVIALCQKYNKPYVLLCGVSNYVYEDKLCRGIFELKNYNNYPNESMQDPIATLKRLFVDPHFLKAIGVLQ